MIVSSGRVNAKIQECFLYGISMQVSGWLCSDINDQYNANYLLRVINIIDKMSK